MADRGGVSVKTIVLMLGVVLNVGMAAPTEKEMTLHNEGDCRVGSYLDVKEQPLNVSLVAYVTRSDNVMLGFFFPGLDPEKDRDAVRFNSTGGTHSEVRDGKSIWTPLAFPRLIPEGWNTFNVTADERGVVKVTLVEDRDTTTLFTLPPLRHAPDTLHAEGRVARCSRVTPTWEVRAGDEVLVPLQPPWSNGRRQWVVVSGGGWEGASPYVIFLCSANSKEIPLTTDTTFEITSSTEGDNVHNNVSKVAKNGGGDGSGDEVVMNCNIPINDSLKLEVVGGRGGDDSTTNTITLIRLLLSSPHTESNSVSESVPASTYTTYRNVGIVLGVVLGLVLLIGVMKVGRTALSS